MNSYPAYPEYAAYPEPSGYPDYADYTTYPTYPMPDPAYNENGYYSPYDYTVQPGYYPVNSAFPPPQPPLDPYGFYFPQPPPPSHPMRPATAHYTTRQHRRHSNDPRGMAEYLSKFSPRYNSNGQYATAAPNSWRKRSWTGARRRPSYSSFESVCSDNYDQTDSFIEENDQPRRATKQGTKYRGHGPDAKYSRTQQCSDKEEESAPHSPYERQSKRAPRPSPTIPKRTQHTRTSSAQEKPKRPQSARPSASFERPKRRTNATEKDARRHKLPPGLSLKYWDPTEQPILLLGSVFDADSLGRWIYDWTVFRHRSQTPISEMAADLWLLLINVSDKLKYAELYTPRVRSADDREMLNGFIKSGCRLSIKLKKLLASCEAPMLRLGSYDSDDFKLGPDAGIEFVDSLFGRDRGLESTEKYIASMRLWNLRFDANCEDVLQKFKQRHQK